MLTDEGLAVLSGWKKPPWEDDLRTQGINKWKSESYKVLRKAIPGRWRASAEATRWERAWHVNKHRKTDVAGVV